MKKIIILSLMLCLTGCLTPQTFRKDYKKESGRYSTYKVTDYDDGFKVDMTFYKFDALGTGADTTFLARNKLKNIAMWIAEAREKKICPIKIKNIESSHYHNTATQHTHWQGNVRVYYKNK